MTTDADTLLICAILPCGTVDSRISLEYQYEYEQPSIAGTIRVLTMEDCCISGMYARTAVEQMDWITREADPVLSADW